MMGNNCMATITFAGEKIFSQDTDTKIFNSGETESGDVTDGKVLNVGDSFSQDIQQGEDSPYYSNL